MEYLLAIWIKENTRVLRSYTLIVRIFWEALLFLDKK
jgi:hypothetical protein